MKYILLLLFKIAFSSFTSNEKTVWNYLIKQGFTQAGAAGLMGNLKADSSVRSILYEESYKKKLGWSNQEYVDKVNNGEYSENDFVNDKIGFGLAQWTYPTRKKALYDNCKGKMGNLKCQLEYLVDELKNDYSEVNELLKSSNNIRECTIKVLTDFENPKRKDSSVQDFRTKLSNKFYNGFVENSKISSTSTPSISPFFEIGSTQIQSVEKTLSNEQIPTTSPEKTSSYKQDQNNEPETTPPVKTYVVKEGDSLYEIASKYNTSIDNLVKINNISNPSLIHPNQVIKIP